MPASRRAASVSDRVARVGASAYPRRVIVTRLLSLLALIALVIGPISMLGADPAGAMSDRAGAAATEESAAVETAHPCHQDRSSDDRQVPSDKAGGNCCVMSCVALPALEDGLAVQPPQVSIPVPMSRMRDPHGLRPEAEPPPPRYS